MSGDRVYNVLFLCTGNSARSILAESILQKDGAGRFRAFSAGSQPKGEVNPLALKALRGWDYPADGFRSKSWQEFAAAGAPVMDFVFTVCDSAAGEACPVWPGQPMTAHWGIEDPASVEGTEIEKLRAFNAAFRYLKTRISLFTALPFRSLDAMALGAKLREIGQGAGSSSPVFTIYHNPDCGTSRNTLAVIRHAGIEPTVIEYLKTPPARDRLRELAHRMGRTVREILRERGTPFAELNLGNPALTEDQLLDAIEAHPILMNRPIVVAPRGVKLCRPSDTVLDLLPEIPPGDVDKDDGTPFLADTKIPGDAEDLVQAMIDAGLPTADLADPGQTFYRFNLLGGDTVGYGGFALCGREVLLRSVARTKRSSGHVGPTIVQLLMSRAFDAGARQAYALTATTRARAFFERQRFEAINRAAAPAAIRATRQMTGLCPSSAALLTRRIDL